jgi:hypothetical protein
MNSIQLHLLTNHLPSIGQIVGILVLLTGLLRASAALQNTGAWIILISAITILPVSWSGESAEEQIENISGVSETQIEAHEDAAGRAWVMTLVNGVVAIVWLVLSRTAPQMRTWLSAVFAITSVVSVILIALASHQGGLIRHPELNSAAQSTIQGHSGDENGDDD